MAVQQKPVVNVAPDAVVVTNRRILVFRSKLLGRMEFVDCLWLQVHDVHVEENLIGSTMKITGKSGHVETVDYLPKAQSRRVYRIAQEMEEAQIDKLRSMELEERRAGASQTVVNTNVASAPAGSPVDPIAKLQQLKQLVDAGVISQQDFDAKKAEMLKLF
jgi:hypothetical protein